MFVFYLHSLFYPPITVLKRQHDQKATFSFSLTFSFPQIAQTGLIEEFMLFMTCCATFNSSASVQIIVFSYNRNLIKGYLIPDNRWSWSKFVTALTTFAKWPLFYFNGVHNTYLTQWKHATYYQQFKMFFLEIGKSFGKHSILNLILRVQFPYNHICGKERVL